MNLEGKRVKFCTLGCKLNFSETATFARLLQSVGAVVAKEGEVADVCIVNTCAVTEVATAKGRQAISRMVRENPEAFVVVTGCYAQLSPSHIATLDGVDLVMGTHEKAHFLECLESALDSSEGGTMVCCTSQSRDIQSFFPSCSRGNRTRYFLKVQDGCNHYCTYCTIPFARGHSRNPSIASLVAQAKQAACEGAREIVVTGVNIGDFGRSTGEKFFDLVCALNEVEGICRYRISSLEPELIEERLIRFCASDESKFMPHFHIPLQSGANEVLRLMHRRYDTSLFSEKIDLIRRLIPHAFIGVDVMVGCRGETPHLWEECYEYVKDLDVNKLHVFPYSERPGTAALRIDHRVAEEEKHRRARILVALSEEKQRPFYESFLGQTRPVLFEHSTHGHSMQGFTDNYIRVVLPPEESSPTLDNEIKMARLVELTPKGHVACTLVP